MGQVLHRSAVAKVWPMISALSLALSGSLKFVSGGAFFAFAPVREATGAPASPWRRS